MLKKISLLISLFVLGLVTAVAAQQSRHFTFHYAFTVKDIAAGEKVRVWIPAAHSNAFQTVKIISATGDLSLKKARESRYG